MNEKKTAKFEKSSQDMIDEWRHVDETNDGSMASKQEADIDSVCKWLRSNVDIVACQQGIHENIQRQLVRAGVLPLERLSQANAEVIATCHVDSIVSTSLTWLHVL